MAYQAAAAKLRRDRRASVLVLVPSRPLARQHAVDAAWLRDFGISVNLLLPDDGLQMWQAVLAGPGLIITTPQSLINRLPRLGARLSDTSAEAVFFDEIDIAVTKDFDERKDVWPAVDAVRDARLPIIGYTGTSLSEEQQEFWQQRGFGAYFPDIPEDWLPLTDVVFRSVTHEQVITTDRMITQELGRLSALFEELGGDPKSWSQITTAAKTEAGRRGDTARAILGCHTERLQLFEGTRDGGLKYETVAGLVEHSSALVLCRYISSAIEVHQHLRDDGIAAVLAHGELRAAEADRRIRLLRTGAAQVLVMTRDLGGRGLDFPEVSTAVLVSPRANYQAVAQELARIRSRREAPKSTAVLFYASTTEAAKARRLGESLEQRHTYRGQPTFNVTALPDPVDEGAEEPHRYSVLEESLPLR